MSCHDNDAAHAAALQITRISATNNNKKKCIPPNRNRTAASARIPPEKNMNKLNRLRGIHYSHALPPFFIARIPMRAPRPTSRLPYLNRERAKQ